MAENISDVFICPCLNSLPSSTIVLKMAVDSPSVPPYSCVPEEAEKTLAKNYMCSNFSKEYLGEQCVAPDFVLPNWELAEKSGKNLKIL